MPAKHTPGPWSIDDYGVGQRIVVKGRKGFSGDYRVADAHFSSDLANCVRIPEMQANAKLIAAAPELLAALKSIADGPTFSLSDVGSDAVFLALNEAMKTARAALAKANA